MNPVFFLNAKELPRPKPIAALLSAGLLATSLSAWGAGGFPETRNTPLSTPQPKSGNGFATAPLAPNAPSLNRWFYIVNGTGIPSDHNAPFTPTVLGVNGSQPSGAPAPNTTYVIGTQSLVAGSGANQLWMAIDTGDGDGSFYLRSAQSFRANQSGNTVMPNPMVGWSRDEVLMDLGAPDGGGLGIYLNQKSNPTGDQSIFQKWLYKTNSAELIHKQTSKVMVNSGQLGITFMPQGSATAPGDQWYAYPNYYIADLVQQPESSPPFPAPQTTGQQAAYDYISNHLMGAGATATCTYGTGSNATTYSGLRCQYANSGNYQNGSNPTVDDCAGYTSGSNPNPGSYNNITISDSDWSTVNTQIYQECYAAQNVLNAFGEYYSVFQDIFMSTSNDIPALGLDMGVSNQSVSISPMQIADVVLTTTLDFTGLGSAAAFANLFAMGVGYANGNSATAITTNLESEVSQLYKNLSTEFSKVSTATASAETAILSDWGRLSAAGPIAASNNYNGLLITDSAKIVGEASKAYQLAVMQALLPMNYQLNVSVGRNFSAFGDTKTYDGGKPPSYDQWSTSTFNATTGSWNIGYVQEKSHSTNYPDSTVMQQDTLGNGAQPFQLFNGIDAWGTLQVASDNMVWGTVIATLYNGTSQQLYAVLGAPSQGVTVVPGVDFHANQCNGGLPTCFSGNTSQSVTMELRPYGYVSVYAAMESWPSGKCTVSVPLTIWNNDINTEYAATVIKLNACNGYAEPDWELTATPASGWNLTKPGSKNGPTGGTHGGPAGIWSTVIYKS